MLDKRKPAAHIFIYLIILMILLGPLLVSSPTTFRFHKWTPWLIPLTSTFVFAFACTSAARLRLYLAVPLSLTMGVGTIWIAQGFLSYGPMYANLLRMSLLGWFHWQGFTAVAISIAGALLGRWATVKKT